MTFVVIQGGIILLFGMYMLGSIAQFYAGQRRDLYFHPRETWIGLARIGGALSLIGAGLVLAAILPTPYTTPMILTACIVLTGGWWLAAPGLLRIFPPRWVRDLEKNRQQHDIDAIMENGAALLMQYPDTFRRVIRHPAGWDIWMMTVTKPLPLATLDSYVQRAQLAIQYNLHPVAIKAAEEIIKYRPDQPLGYRLRARAHLGNHHFNKALEDLSICIVMQPNDASLYYQRARVYRLLEQHQNAERDIKTAAALDKNHQGNI